MFRASPSGILRYANQIERASESAAKAKTYLDDNCNLSHDGEGFAASILFPRNDEIYKKVSEFADDAIARLDASSEALVAAADYYRTTDEEAAARVDASLAPTRIRPGVQE